MDDQKLLELKTQIEKLLIKNQRFLIAVAGPISVGKSTFAQMLKNLLDNQYPTQVVASDGFLFNNQELESKKLFDKKGWPESFDNSRLEKFLSDVKKGDNPSYHTYSQELSDIDYQKEQVINPETQIVIVEGINILQNQFIDLFDFKIYLDAAKSDLINWYIKRSLDNIHAAKNNPQSWFQQFSALSDQEIKKISIDIWEDVNQVNIENYIKPTKDNADILISFDSNHGVTEMTL